MGQHGELGKEQTQGAPQEIDVGSKDERQLYPPKEVLHRLAQEIPVFLEQEERPGRNPGEVGQHRGPGGPDHPQFRRAQAAEDQGIIRSNIYQIGHQGNVHRGQSVGRTQKESVQGQQGQDQGHRKNPHRK